MVWFFYVILMNLLKPKCFACLLACWLAGCCHTHVATAEGINIELMCECVRLIEKKIPGLSQQACSKVCTNCVSELGTPEEAPVERSNLLGI